MRRLCVMLCLVVAVLIGGSQTVAAHVLAQDNGVSVVLHIPPFDAPQANELTSLEFQFGTDNGSFSLNDYKIDLLVLDNGQQIQHMAVPSAYFGSASLATTTITFPKIAVYQLVLHGTAITPGKPNFSVTYSVRVPVSHTGSHAARQSNGGQVVLIGAAILILFGMVAARQIVVGKRYAKIRK